MKPHHSKTILLLILSTVLIVSSGCGGGEEESQLTTAVATTAGATSTPATPTVSPNAVSTPGITGKIPANTGTIADKAIRLPQPELENIRYGGTLRMASSRAAGNLDPKFNNQNTVELSRPVLETLIIWTPNENDPLFHVAPNLAESWSISQDLTTYTFKLRKGIKWQNLAPVNGRELAADDVAFSLRRYTESDSTWFGAYKEVESITAKDKYTVEIKLSTPSAWAVNDLFPNIQWVIARETIISDKEGIGANLIGTGPYILKEYKFRNRAVYERNPDYWKKDSKSNVLPYLDRIEMIYMTDPATSAAAYRTNQIDLGGTFNAPDHYLQLAESVPGMRLYWVNLGIRFGMAFNTKNKPWSDVNLRRAFSMAVDRLKYAETISPGPGLWDLVGPLPWSLVSNTELTSNDLGPYYKYNPEESKRHRIAAGFTDGKVKVATPIYFGTGQNSILGTVTLQELWRKEGIEVDVLRLDIITSQDTYYKRSWQDIGNTFQNTGDYSLNWFAQNKFKCENFQNSSWICDAEVQKVVNEIRLTTDPAKLKDLARFLWDFDTLQVYNVWLPSLPSFSVSGPRVRNHVIRQGFANDVTYEWLTDAPRTTP